jgi:hypothetical protein
MRRRARVFTSVRTATRNFDLELAIATLRLHTQLYVEIETIPVVFGGNRAGLSQAWRLVEGWVEFVIEPFRCRRVFLG